LISLEKPAANAKLERRFEDSRDFVLGILAISLSALRGIAVWPY